MTVLDLPKPFDVKTAFVERGDVPTCFAAGAAAGLTGTIAPAEELQAKIFLQTNTTNRLGATA